MWKTIQFFTQLSRKFFKQLSSSAISLNFVVELVDVVTHRDKENLNKDLLVAAKQELAKSIILLDDSEGPLRLNRAVHSKQNTFLASNAHQRLLTLLNEHFRDIKCSVALSTGTYLFVRAAFTTFTLVVGNFAFKTGFALPLADTNNPEFFPSLASILVKHPVIRHVFPQHHVALVFLRFGPLVILGFDVTFGCFALKICVVFLALVTRVRRHIPIASSQMCLHVVNKRDEYQLIASFTRNVYTCYVFAFNPELDVVARLQLRIAHVVVLHMHKRRVRIGFGKAVATFEGLLIPGVL